MPLTLTAISTVASILFLSANAHASFYTHIVQLGAGGADTTIDDVSEVAGLLDGGFGSSEILVDQTLIRSVIDLGTEGDFGLDLLYPDGSTGDSTGGPFAKEQFAVRARATLTIPAGDWTIAFESRVATSSCTTRRRISPCDISTERISTMIRTPPGRSTGHET